MDSCACGQVAFEVMDDCIRIETATGKVIVSSGNLPDGNRHLKLEHLDCQTCLSFFVKP